MVRIDRIEHNVTIPEGVTATLSEDGVVTIAGPNGSLSRTFESSRVEILQDGGGLIVRTDLPRRKDKALAGTLECSLQQYGQRSHRWLHVPSQGILLSLPNDVGSSRTELCCQQLLR